MGKIAHVLKWINDIRAARAGDVATQAETQASRSPLLYNSPQKPERPFEADYPNGTAANGDLSSAPAGSVLRRDMDGRPLTARSVVGRTVVDGRDQPIAPSELDALAESLIGSRPQAVSQRQLAGDSGRLIRSVDPRTGEPAHTLLVDQSLRPELQQRVVAHEVGHYLDDATGGIDTQGLSRELSDVYNTLNTGRERATRRMGPQHIGYEGDEIPREQMAEAIRAYLADPNYLKTVAPKTAAAIRAAVNPHPRLRDIIQFNTLAPAGVGLGAMATSPDAVAPNRLTELVVNDDTIEPVEYPRLQEAADAIDAYRRQNPLIETLSPVSLEGSAELIRNFGRERPASNRLLEVINLF